MNTFFSVIVPTYNRAERLGACLKSILAQNYPHFEIILVDDGSTDHTKDYIEEHFGQEQKLHYFYKKNEERSVARNYGVAQSKGDFLTFFDSDDIMLPNYLEVLAQKIQENPQISIFATKFVIKNGHKASFSEGNTLPEGLYDYSILIRGNIFRLVVLQKNAFRYAFPVEFNLCEDWIFNILNIYGNKIFFIDQIAYEVIEHEGRSMNQHRKIILARQAATEYILEKIALKAEEQKQIRGHSFRFCAIHAYADGERQQAYFFWKKALKNLGYSKEILVLGLKIVLGKKFIDVVKSVLG